MHTPGPWTAHETENHMHTLHDARGHHFCNLRNMRRDTSADDARLIAAAPDLLHVLQAVEGDSIAMRGFSEQFRATIRTAISKATGEI
jgi:hypothetical protein